jgi:hypothetical protein
MADLSRCSDEPGTRTLELTREPLRGSCPEASSVVPQAMTVPQNVASRSPAALSTGETFSIFGNVVFSAPHLPFTADYACPQRPHVGFWDSPPPETRPMGCRERRVEIQDQRNDNVHYR